MAALALEDHHQRQTDGVVGRLEAGSRVGVIVRAIADTGREVVGHLKTDVSVIRDDRVCLGPQNVGVIGERDRVGQRVKVP